MAGPVDAGRRIARLIGAADNAPGVIRAYHGSPHSFSRFDASKIGTGEGAQNFGHGLYFAGNENVAKSYRDALERMALPQTAEEMASDYLRSWHRLDAAKQMAQTHLQDAASYGIPDERQALIKSAIALMDSGQARVMPPRGHMYEVEIDAPEESLLDWDASVHDQNMNAQAVFGNVRDQLFWPGAKAKYAGAYLDSDQAIRWNQAVMTGRPKGMDLWHAASVLEGPDSAAQFLASQGIPGIRYLDQGSRSAGQGTRNYVMFPGTEDRISILRQYGLLPPLAGGLALQEEE